MNIDPSLLQKLASRADSALEIGKAAEHIVCAELILQGHKAFLSDQGLSYDVVADVDGRLIRIQVKACCFAKNVNAKGRVPRVAYSWAARRRGKRGSSRLQNSDCDVVAFVAVDIQTVAYLPIQICGQAFQVGAPGTELKTKFKSGTQWARNVDQFPFAEAVAGDLSIYKSAFRQQTHCLHGHEFTPSNTYLMASGSRACRECTRVYYQKTKHRRRGPHVDMFAEAAE